MGEAGRTVTVADADLVLSCWLVAFTVTFAGEGTAAGAVYRPVAKIVPQVLPLQPAPVTVQVMPVFGVPETEATNAWVDLTVRLALPGDTLTVIGAGAVPLTTFSPNVLLTPLKAPVRVTLAAVAFAETRAVNPTLAAFAGTTTQVGTATPALLLAM